MFKTFLFLLSSSIFPSFLNSGVAGQCNGCSHQISYWLASEMMDLERAVCKSSIVSNEVVKSSIILLLDQSRAMMGDGRLKVRGRRGNVGATGGTGFIGGSGAYGAAGATGPMGQMGAPGAPGFNGARGITGAKGVSGNRRAKRHALSSREVHKAKTLFKRQTSTTIFDKINPFISDCPTYRDYFTSFANQLDNLTSWNGLTSTDELNRLINKYREVQDLYRNVSQTFESLKNIVQNDPRYIGATGATGFHGRTGVNGNSGFTGHTGSVGDTGDIGFPGVPGLRGSTGDTGATGTG